MAHALNWFEIPVEDLERAKAFYEAILVAKMSVVEMNSEKLALFPTNAGDIGGALVKSDRMTPSANGTMVYLNGGRDLTLTLDRVEPAGGKVVLFKTEVSEEIGSIAVFLDTEGNQVALHSPE